MRKSRISGHANRVVVTAFGGVSPLVVVVAVGMLIFLGFATDSLRDLLHAWWMGEQSDVPVSLLWGQVIFFCALLAVLILVSRWFSGEPEYDVRNLDKRFTSKLAQSLSVLTNENINLVREFLHAQDGKTVPDELPDVLAKIPWAQNLRSIIAAGRQLRFLGVVTSTTSHAQLDLFKALVAQFAPRAQIVTDGEGVDFDDMEACRDAWLRVAVKVEKQAPRRDALVVDITSGGKPTTVTGTMIAVKRGRRLVYVSTTSHVATVWEVNLANDG